MERVELGQKAVEELTEALKGKKVFLAFIDGETFRNVVPLYLGEVGEVKEGEGSLEVEGSEGKFKAFGVGNKTLIVVKGKEANEIAIVDVPIDELKSFLTEEEGYEADESLLEGAEEEGEEEWEPE
ncbi:hypothetical protein [Ignicoccus hospitalis]|uniref:Uncharacterized protein n=1 Tax=Ignicoccus hospitalis (strain KIN4/I / DSM 18386 / JCM 14125) TaxID=453591 RepID=A8A9G1_IGNH4|nr:hypothetical protein [Ignicoccus hospitalis]ABU81563.1 hypothetical protein Igni_0380 [Ignicoccus hospitalis KIN4/I]HIH90498.1 hypothetical protein [Desulfurococcaceae archaeon]